MKKYILTLAAFSIFSCMFNEQTVNAMSDRIIERREKVTITDDPRVRPVDDIVDTDIGTIKETSDITTKRINDDLYNDNHYYDRDSYVVRRSYGRPYRRSYRRDYYDRPYRRYYDGRTRRYRRVYYDDRVGNVVGGAATGALIGGIAGGGRGAAIGAGVGAGLGLIP